MSFKLIKMTPQSSTKVLRRLPLGFDGKLERELLDFLNTYPSSWPRKTWGSLKSQVILAANFMVDKGGQDPEPLYNGLSMFHAVEEFRHCLSEDTYRDWTRTKRFQKDEEKEEGEQEEQEHEEQEQEEQEEQEQEEQEEDAEKNEKGTTSSTDSSDDDSSSGSGGSSSSDSESEEPAAKPSQAKKEEEGSKIPVITTRG